MDKCQYYKGTDLIGTETTKILCSYMTSGGKVFNNKDPEGAALIQCCWHGGENCPIMEETEIASEQIGFDEIPPDVDDVDSEDDDVDISDMNEGQQLQLIADTFDYSSIKCPFFGNEGKLIPYPMIGGLTFKCNVCKMEFVSSGKLTEWLSRCTENPNLCLHYRQNIKDQESMIAEVQDTSVSTERRDRAVQLNNRIRANNALAAQCILEIAKDLKTMNAEKLYTEVGCSSFGEYCETLGMRERHGYNFISLLDRFGEEQLGSLQKYGVTKLIEMSKLDDEDLSDLIESGTVEDMTVKELKEKIREYEKQTEQLTLDLGEVREKNAELMSGKEEAEKRQAEEYRKKIESIEADKKALADKLEQLEKRSAENDEKIRAENERYTDENKKLVQRIKDLEKRPPEKAEVSDEDKEKIRAEAEKSVREEYEKKIAEADKAASDKMEKLREENQRLQSIAEKSAPATSDEKEKIRFYLGEIQRSFNAAVEVISAAAPGDREKYRGAMRTALERMGGALDAE